MHITDFIQNDGYDESIAYFLADFPCEKRQPIFRIRAVLISNGSEGRSSSWIAVVRSFDGFMIEEDRGFDNEGFPLSQARKQAITLALRHLYKESKEAIITTDF